MYSGLYKTLDSFGFLRKRKGEGDTRMLSNNSNTQINIRLMTNISISVGEFDEMMVKIIA